MKTEIVEEEGTRAERNTYLLLYTLYSACTFLIPIRRIQMQWTTFSTGANTILGVVFQLHLGLPLYLIPVVAMLVAYPKFILSRVWNCLFNYSHVLLVGSALVAACFLLSLARVPGFWWTWFTMGLYIGAVVAAVVLLDGKVSSGVAVIIGVGLVSLTIGLWEIPYQIGLKLQYDAPQIGTELAWAWIKSEITLEMGFIVGGAGLVFGVGSYLKCIRWSWITTGLFAIAVAFYVIWFATGFWVDVYYKWVDNIWVQSAPNTAAMMVYRVSKAATMLGFLSLLNGGTSHERLSANDTVPVDKSGN